MRGVFRRPQRSPWPQLAIARFRCSRFVFLPAAAL